MTLLKTNGDELNTGDVGFSAPANPSPAATARFSECQPEHPNSDYCRTTSSAEGTSSSEPIDRSDAAAEFLEIIDGPHERDAAWADHLYQRVKKFIDDGRVPKALRSLNQHRAVAVVLRNARGVCLLRLDNAKAAVRVFAHLLDSLECDSLEPDVLKIFRANYATALLMTGDVAGCTNVLDEIDDEFTSQVMHLRAFIHRWKSDQTFWNRLARTLGFRDRQITLDFTPGKLTA